MASSETSRTLFTCAWAMGNMSSPTRFGASESAAIPPASASTGRPASNARVRVGAASGSTPMILILEPYQAAMPPISPPPPTATNKTVEPGSLLFKLLAHRTLAQQGFQLIVGVNDERSGLCRP